MASSDSQINKCPKRAELPDVNINKGAQSINTESLFKGCVEEEEEEEERVYTFPLFPHSCRLKQNISQFSFKEI